MACEECGGGTPTPESIECKDVTSCVNIGSEDSSVGVTPGCDYINIFLNGGHIDKAMSIIAGECIKFTKSFVKGKLVLKPVIDWNCARVKIGTSGLHVVSGKICNGMLILTNNDNTEIEISMEEVCAPEACGIPTDLSGTID